MGSYKILSIDGGGIRGVIPAMLLVEIEERMKKPVSSLFDLIAGTSTGGILAAGLTTPENQSVYEPKFKASDLLGLYEERGKDIFARSLWDGITSGWGLSDERYPSDNIEEVLNEYFGDIELKDVLTEILVTSYEIEERHPYFFKSSRAKSDPVERNHFLRDVARATSAAPTYFEPAKIPTVSGSSDARIRYLVDGGVFANNPAMCAFAEAIRLGKSLDDIILVSLGTGVGIRPIDYDKAKDWGLIRWAKPVIDVMMDGGADAVDYQLEQMLLPAKSQYYRFNTRLREALDDMDAANRANINALKRDAEHIIRTNGAELDALCTALG